MKLTQAGRGWASQTSRHRPRHSHLRSQLPADGPMGQGHPSYRIHARGAKTPLERICLAFTRSRD